MTTRHKRPNRKPRGPRATLPKVEPESLPPCGPNPHPEIGDAWAAHIRDFCGCWHLYDECPCFRVDHQPAHLAVECECTLETA